ncbi:MAG: hypothetical protein IJJ00_04265 [Erysipelotrichaceae bacterium]|nr:hypothetical protein [Erysipelotrichaceae bacterium]
MKTIDYCKKIFYEASCFYEESSSTFEKVLKCSLYYDENNQPVLERDAFYYFTFVIVNGVFACELFLKSLICYKTNNEIQANRTHSLKKLINLLSKDDREIIMETFDKNEIDESSFNSKIDEIDTAFVDWRYVFEEGKHRSVDLVFLDHLLGILRYIATEAFENDNKKHSDPV